MPRMHACRVGRGRLRLEEERKLRFVRVDGAQSAGEGTGVSRVSCLRKRLIYALAQCSLFLSIFWCVIKLLSNNQSL